MGSKAHIVLIVAAVLLAASPAVAKVAIVGKGASMHLDPSTLPPQQREIYDRVVRVKCANCHTLERVMVAVKTGIAPISGLPFNKNSARRYGIKMMRKLDSGMTGSEIKDAVSLLNYLLDDAGR